jgi:hypothetical protein
MTWLETLRNLKTETTRDAVIVINAASSATGLSESLTQQSDESARSPSSPPYGTVVTPSN